MAIVEMDTELLLEKIKEILRYNNNYKVTINLFGLYGTVCVEIEKVSSVSSCIILGSLHGTVCVEIEKVSLPYNERIFMDRGENFNKRLINIYEFLIHNVPNLCLIQKNE